MHDPTADRSQSVASPGEYQRQSSPSGIFSQREPPRLGVSRLDDATGEVEVATDERLDVSRLDSVFAVLGEIAEVPLELLLSARQSDQPPFGCRIGRESHVQIIYRMYRRRRNQRGHVKVPPRAVNSCEREAA